MLHIVFSSHLFHQVVSRKALQRAFRPKLSLPRLNPPNRIKVHNLRNVIRKYTNEPDNGKDTKSTTRSGPTLKERLLAPASGNASSVGKGALAGAAAIGLFALCFYGISYEDGKKNIYGNSKTWPQYVRDRVHSVYFYFGSACALTALSAYLAFQSPFIINLVTRQGWVALAGTTALLTGSGFLAQSITYAPGFGIKQLAWAVHCALIGAVIAPICILGGPLISRAALYTGGIVGGLSILAMCAPNDKFLYMGGPLALGLGLVFAASLANMWLPPTTAIGAGLASLSLYGGLILFSGFLLHDTQRVVMLAEQYPKNQYVTKPFDPINASMAIYMDALQIFLRIVQMLAQNSGEKKKQNDKGLQPYQKSLGIPKNRTPNQSDQKNQKSQLKPKNQMPNEKNQKKTDANPKIPKGEKSQNYQKSQQNTQKSQKNQQRPKSNK